MGQLQKSRSDIEPMLTGVTVLVSPRSTHNCKTVRLPIQAIVKSPTHFTLTVAPSPRPVATSQNHQLGSNAFAGPCSCWFEKQVHARAVKAVKITRGESRRIRRDCVRSPFSIIPLASFSASRALVTVLYRPKMISPAPIAAVVVRQPAAFNVRNIVGTVKTPKTAGNNRMAT